MSKATKITKHQPVAEIKAKNTRPNPLAGTSVPVPQIKQKTVARRVEPVTIGKESQPSPEQATAPVRAAQTRDSLLFAPIQFIRVTHTVNRGETLYGDAREAYTNSLEVLGSSVNTLLAGALNVLARSEPTTVRLTDNIKVDNVLAVVSYDERDHSDDQVKVDGSGFFWEFDAQVSVTAVFLVVNPNRVYLPL